MGAFRKWAESPSGNNFFPALIQQLMDMIFVIAKVVGLAAGAGLLSSSECCGMWVMWTSCFRVHAGSTIWLLFLLISI